MTVDGPFRVVFAAAPPASTPSERLRATCALRDVAVAQLKARLRRERPGISDDEVALEVRRWLAAGDLGPGRPREWRG